MIQSIHHISGQSSYSDSTWMSTFKVRECYDVLKCITPTDKKERELKFKLSWDMNTEFGGKVFPTEIVINNRNAIYERIGALLVKDPWG
ncbi:hypothetical protein [Pedobacter africanus]|uniref:Uncharacterized protein n=1 Tax=Pedobacter africanus TaxID=151894 RepID=A0A1W2CRW8_9SPHI|nr:hypothetical protein [Pedobacter africanus]SMC87706.1 hypothetical protein SAMN04488524_3151 [Pedobacter africanus]